MNNNNFDELLANKKILFSGFAAFGGLLSAIITLGILGEEYSAFLSWTLAGALDAALIGAMIVYAQSYYQTKIFSITSGLKIALKQGLIIGFLGGIGAFICMKFFGEGELGRYIGWAFSGGVAGYVVSGQVPNLKQSTAIWAGMIGGFIGCLLLSLDFGYTFGVAFTGAAIGLMVAMAEVMFRKSWLDIQIYSEPLSNGINLSKPINQFTLTLGVDSIKIGSNKDMDIQLKNPSAEHENHFASIYYDNGGAIFHNLIDGSKTTIQVGIPFNFYECKLKVVV